jgi:hypothetical protein
VCRHGDDEGPFPVWKDFVADTLGELKTVHFQHRQVEQDDIRAMGLNRYQRLKTTTDGNRVEAPQAKNIGHRIADIRTDKTRSPCMNR